MNQWDPYHEFESDILPNGLHLHVAHWPRPWITVGIQVHSGAEHDPEGQEGVAHLVEHLVSRNAPLPKQEIRSFFDSCGGRPELGETGHAYSRYGFFAPDDCSLLERAFLLYGRMLLEGRLHDGVQEERETIISEFRRAYPLRFVLDLEIRENRALYGDCWLGRCISPHGWPLTVSRLSPDDAQAYYDRHYSPANMSIVCVGGLRTEEVLRILRETPFSRRGNPSRVPPPEPARHAPLPAEREHTLHASRYLSGERIEAGTYRSVARVPGCVSLSVLRLARRMLERMLLEEIREKRRWAYAVSCEIHSFGYFHQLSVDCDSVALEAVERIGEAVDWCFRILPEQAALFEQAKRHALAAVRMLDLTSRETRDKALSDVLEKGRIMTLSHEAEEVSAASQDDLVFLASWLAPERRWTLITRP